LEEANRILANDITEQKRAEAALKRAKETAEAASQSSFISLASCSVGRADALIITGGIGPTQDDLTREEICAAAAVPMDFAEDYADHLRRWWQARGREMPATNLRQAEHPRGAELIPNAKGTAPGLRLRVGQCWVFALPGVPQEMLPMVDEHVIPFLLDQAGVEGGVLVSQMLRTWGESESRVAEIVGDLYDTNTNPTLAFLAIEGFWSLRLMESDCIRPDEVQRVFDRLERELERSPDAK